MSLVTKVRLWGDPKPELYEHAQEPAEKFLSGFGVPELDSIGRDNAADACITRIAKIDFREPAGEVCATASYRLAREHQGQHQGL